MAKRIARSGQPDMFVPLVNTAPCVPRIAEAVAAWRQAGYPGTSDTTRLLLQHWFYTEHRVFGRAFRYHDAQREALETLVWLYEVAGVRRQKPLLERFATRQDLRLLQHDTFPRYALKMATGSGKTKVMALAVAWQFFNSVAEARRDFARTFLVVAPNVIVYERLRSDFAGGRIFRADPVVPPALATYWDVECYLRGEPERAASLGALYLANVQQLYPRDEPPDAAPDPLAAVLGARPPAAFVATEGFAERIARRGGPCLVLNDEAHHTHDEESAWNTTIRALDGALNPGGASERGVLQLDVSATPRHTRGTLFSWTVYDYPLKRAILDGVVKRPVKGIVSAKEQPSDVASVRYEPFLTAGVARWKEYREALDATGKKPVLFVMLNSTAEADDVGHYLQTKYPEHFGGEGLLVIHTNNKGDVAVKDEDRARRLAREVDDEKSPVNCIVSVLMLREGWDVQNVTVVVGLRPYSSKAAILPEQTVGRGLRLMFRGGLGEGYRERVDVIGNRAFMDFVAQLEKEEELDLETFTPGKDRLVVETIKPDPDKAAFDIALPILSPILTRKRTLGEEIAAMLLPTVDMPLPRRPDEAAAQTFRYDGLDLITLEREFSREYAIPPPRTAEEIIGYYARLIAQDVKLPSQFAALVPRVRAFLETVAFGVPVNLSDPAIVRALAQPVVGHVVKRAFASALRPLLVEQQTPVLEGAARRLSETPGFPWSRPTLAAARCVFNLVPCDNSFERAFAAFLDAAPEVTAFGKLPEAVRFSIPYTDSALNLRYYEPDFVAVLDDGRHFLLETKGREDLDVAHKDRAATLWCEHASALTDTPWAYKKVKQTEFEALRPDRFEDLLYLG